MGIERWAIAGLLLWLLVGPRIELPGLGGLRAEDLAFAVLAALCLVRFRLRRPMSTTVAVAGVGTTGLLSAAVASGRGMVDPLSSVLFAVRPLEYWVVFPAVLLLLQGVDRRWLTRVDSLLIIVTMLQFAFAVTQYYFGLPWGFSRAAYTRAAGLTVGPYELGAISAMLVVYWISRGRWTMASLSVIALAASVSRVSILGTALAVLVFALGWAIRLLREARVQGWREALRPLRRGRAVLVGQGLSVVAAGVVLAFTVGLIRLPEFPSPSAPAAAAPAGPSMPLTSDEPVASPTESPSTQAKEVVPVQPSDSIAQRLESTSVLGSWLAANSLARQVPMPATSGEYQFAVYTGLNIYVNANTTAGSQAEPSNLIRFFRWNVILDTMNDPADWIFGLGPSFVGPSVDGSYLRMFADGGLLGVLAWAALIVVWLRRRPLWMVCVSISLLIGAVFIDIVYAERPMVLFWTLLAIAVARTAAAPGRSRIESAS